MNATSQIIITKFRSPAATSATQLRCSVGSLADIIRRTDAPTKAALPWLKLAAFGGKRTAKNSLRHDANITAVTGIEADYDGGRMTFDEACETLEKQGIGAIVYTSPSHTEDAPRWRVLCPLTGELAPSNRDHFMGRLNGLFRGVFAIESWTLSQAYYYGSVAENPSHRVEIIEGETIEAHDDLDVTWIGRPTAAPAAGAGGGADAGGFAGDVREDAELIRRIVTGEGLHPEMVALSARYVARGVPPRVVCELLRGLLLSQPAAARDERWQDRYDDIGRTVATARAKFASRAEQDRKAVAKLAVALARRCRPDNEMRWHVGKAALAIGLTLEEADSIIDWARRAVATGETHNAA